MTSFFWASSRIILLNLNGLNRMNSIIKTQPFSMKRILILSSTPLPEKAKERHTWMCPTVKLCYQFKADVASARRNSISDVDVSIVSLIKSQVIHLTGRLLDQCSTCSGLIPLNKMSVLIRIGGSPSGRSKDRELWSHEKGCLTLFESQRYWEAVWAGDASSPLIWVFVRGWRRGLCDFQ